MKKILIAIICLVSLNNLSAQDAHFSQYYASGLYLNPSAAGAQPFLTFSSNYRTQWRSVVIPYVTSQMSLIYPLHTQVSDEDKHVGGIGLSFYNDRAGEGNFKTIGVNVNAAYNLPLSVDRNHFISVGVQAGMIQKNIDYTNLEWGEQFNPYIGFDATVNPNVGVNAGTLFADFAAGFTYYLNAGELYSDADEATRTHKVSGYIGASAYHLNEPNESFYNNFSSKLPRLYKGYGGLNFHFSPKFDVSPNALFMMQGDRNQLNAGLYLTYKFSDTQKAVAPAEVILGGWYRLEDAYIFSMGFGNDRYTLGFSYDMNASSLRYATNGRGAYEVSLTIHKVKEKRIRRYYTPRI